MFRSVAGWRSVLLLQIVRVVTARRVERTVVSNSGKSWKASVSSQSCENRRGLASEDLPANAVDIGISYCI